MPVPEGVFKLTGDGKRPGLDKYPVGNPDCAACAGKLWGQAPRLVNGKVWCATHAKELG